MCCGIAGGNNTFKICNIQLIKTELTANTVEKEPAVLVDGTPSEEPISMVVDTYQDLTKTENEVAFGKAYTAYGCDGWGGYAKIFKFNNEGCLGYNGSSSNAISFYLYIGNETTLNGYKTHFDVDLSSSESYSDDAKLSWGITSLIADCQIGWNKITLLFSNPTQNRSLDITHIYTLRLNCTNSGISSGNTFKVCNFQLIKTDLAANTAEKEVSAPAFEAVAMAVANPTSLTAVQNDVAFGETITSYKIENGSQDAPVMVFDKNYDGTGSNALMFYIYIADETTLNCFKTQFAFDLSTAESYSDSYKYSWAIAPVFANCQVGWNKITLVYNVANEKNNFDITAVHTLRLNYSACGGSSNLNFRIGNFQLVKTDLTANTAEKYTPAEPVKLEVINAPTFTAVSNDMTFGESFTSYQKENGASDAKVIVFSTTGYDGTGSNAISFCIYIADETTLNAFKKQFAFDLSTSGDYSDAHKYSWAIAPVFANCQVGWNRITLLYSAKNENYDFDLTKVTTVRLNYSGCGASEGINYRIGNFQLVETLLTANTAEKYTPAEPVKLEVINAPTFTAVADDTAFGETFTSYQKENGASDAKVIVFSTTGYDGTGSNAISFCIYIADETTLNAFKTQFAFDLSTSGDYSDAHKYSWNITRVFDDCQVGWNRITLLYSAKNEIYDFDVTKVTTVRLNYSGCGASEGINYKVGDFQLVETALTANTVEKYTPAE